jgi:methyl-accepting chemotaxis protein
LSILQNLRVGHKLALLVGVPILGLGIFAAMTFDTVARVRVKGPVYDQIVQGKDLIADVLPPPAYIVEAHMVALEMASAEDRAELEALAQRSRQLKKDYDTRIAHWTKELPEGAMKAALLEESRRPAEAFFALLEDAYVPYLLAEDRDEAEQLLRSDMRAQFDAHRAAIDRVVSMANERAAEDEQIAVATLASRNTVLWSVAGTVGVSALALGWLIGRGITRPLHAMASTVDDMAAGKASLATRMDESRRDELGVLASGINRFTSKLQQVISSARESSAKVGASCGELQESAASMADTMEQQSARVREIASAMTQMSASASEVAQQASDARNAAEQSSQVATKGGQTVETTITGMRAIEQAVQKGAGCVHTLGSRSEAIGQLIQIINDIADQTNLLALNAAIEAARAGEHGRGFAVVADEVRKLADRTQKATSEISQSVRQIQEETGQAVKAMDVGRTQVNEGVRLAGGAGDDLRRILQSTSEVTRMVGSIATAAAEQSSTTEEVSRSLEGMSSAAAHAQKGAEHSAAAIQGLATQADALRKIIDECGLKA